MPLQNQFNGDGHMGMIWDGHQQYVILMYGTDLEMAILNVIDDWLDKSGWTDLK